ncbi:MAG: ribonuclease P protein component, partial [Pseudomonadota bacterium]
IRLIGRHSPNGARLGLVVAKRVLPRAVDRNQVKRQIREAFRLWHARLPSVDLVVQPLQLDVLENPREQVESLLRRVVRERV